jgi:hypothetical protein
VEGVMMLKVGFENKDNWCFAIGTLDADEYKAVSYLVDEWWSWQYEDKKQWTNIRRKALSKVVGEMRGSRISAWGC